jgi:hypothetical protein
MTGPAPIIIEFLKPVFDDVVGSAIGMVIWTFFVPYLGS